MNTKLLSLITAFGLITNAALAGSASIGYVSDFFYRGEQKALESVQSKIDYETSVLGLESAFHACTNQSVDEGVDSYGLSASVGASVIEGLLSVYGGFSHYEDVPGEALSEVFVRASSDVFLSPTVTISRNVDDELFTYEAGVNHGVDLKFASLSLDGSIGSTEITESNTRAYYSVGAELTKAIGSAEAGLSVDLVDADDIDREFVFGASLGFNF